jgi:two-component system LytT family response regulator
MKNDPVYIWVKTPMDLSKLKIDAILYCKKQNRKVEIHLLNEINLSVAHTLMEMEQMLPKMKFCRCHRSYVLNLERVTKFIEKIPTALLENNEKIPVSRDKKHSFIEKLTSL